MKLLLLLATLLSAQSDVDPDTGLFRWNPAQRIERIVFTDRQVPRLRYALELRDDLRKLGRLCDHAEDWERAVRAISEGAPLIEMAVCHREKKTRRTLYRVAARWLEEREYEQVLSRGGCGAALSVQKVLRNPCKYALKTQVEGARKAVCRKVKVSAQEG